MIRSFVVTLFSFIFIILLSSVSYPFGGCDSECQRCHTLSKEEAEDLLKTLAPDIKVIGVKMAPAKGLWEIAVERSGRKGITYIDFAKENVISGQIFHIKTKENLTRKSFVELQRVDFSKIPLEDSLVMGNPEAPTKIVIFDDPD